MIWIEILMRFAPDFLQLRCLLAQRFSIEVDSVLIVESVEELQVYEKPTVVVLVSRFHKGFNVLLSLYLYKLSGHPLSGGGSFVGELSDNLGVDCMVPTESSDSPYSMLLFRKGFEPTEVSINVNAYEEEGVYMVQNE